MTLLLFAIIDKAYFILKRLFILNASQTIALQFHLEVQLYTIEFFHPDYTGDIVFRARTYNAYYINISLCELFLARSTRYIIHEHTYTGRVDDDYTRARV